MTCVGGRSIRKQFIRNSFALPPVHGNRAGV